MTTNPNTITFLFDTFTYFGSGSGFASLRIDGVRMTYAEAEARGWETSFKRDGFNGKSFVHIPLAELRKVRELRHETDFYPGGKSEFKGSGKAYARKVLRVLGSEDPLTRATFWGRAEAGFPAAVREHQKRAQERAEARRIAQGRENYLRKRWEAYGCNSQAEYITERRLEAMRFNRCNVIL